MFRLFGDLLFFMPIKKSRQKKPAPFPLALADPLRANFFGGERKNSAGNRLRQFALEIPAAKTVPPASGKWGLKSFGLFFNPIVDAAGMPPMFRDDFIERQTV